MAQNVNPAASSTGATHTSKTTEGATSVSQDGHAVTKRLQRELMNLMMSKEKGISAFPETENIFNWIATIKGPAETVYEGFTFKLSVSFPVAYPYAPPVVKFTTTCFHPNVDLSGNICLDILREQWSPLYDITAVLLSVQSLLGEPNNKSPLNVDAANLWKNQAAYRQYLVKNYGPPEK